MSKLYIVATPIGNLEDITLRALRILKEVDLVLCEDTRVTKKLLSHYDINVPTESYHSQSNFSKTERVINMLRNDSEIALVSDSGTPTISDPGSFLVKQVREELGDEVQVITVPGPSAVIAGLSISGLTGADFTFFGFLPHKKGRKKIFKEIAEMERRAVFYESPHRLMKALTSLTEHLGEDRKVVVTKELTKIFEQVVSGTSVEVLAYFTRNSDKIKGEFVIMVSGK